MKTGRWLLVAALISSLLFAATFEGFTQSQPDAKATTREAAYRANNNLGELYKQQRDFASAIVSFRRAIETEPYNTTAMYGLGLTLMQSGQREEGMRVMQEFRKVSDAHYGTEIGKEYLEHGRYAEALVSTGAEPELVSPATPEVSFTDATANVISATSPQAAATPTAGKIVGRTINGAAWNDTAKRDLAASFGGGVTLFDYDGDGDLDLFVINAASQKHYRNDGGKFLDVTEAAGLAKTPANTAGIAAVAGDFHHHTKPDPPGLRYRGIAAFSKHRERQSFCATTPGRH